MCRVARERKYDGERGNERQTVRCVEGHNLIQRQQLRVESLLSYKESGIWGDLAPGPEKRTPADCGESKAPLSKTSKTEETSFKLKKTCAMKWGITSAFQEQGHL